MVIRTEWYVITGGPCAGKTTLVNRLAFLGYNTIPEVSRTIIEAERSRGRTAEEIRTDALRFQRLVLEKSIEVEDRTPPLQTTFLDNAIPSNVPYRILAGVDPRPALDAAQKRRYRGVFLLDQLPFEKDHVRTEDAELAQRLNKMIGETYERLGYEVVRIPVNTVERRAELVLEVVRRDR